MTILYQLLRSKATDIYSVIEKPDRFSEIVDVRSPNEFRDDHIPGAINLPVLSNEERSLVGTLYKQDSFEGKKFCLLYTSPSPRDLSTSRMPSSA